MNPSLSRSLALLVVGLGVIAVAWTLLRPADSRPSVAEIRAGAAEPTSGAETSVPDEPDPSVAEPAVPIPVLAEADTLTDLDGWLNTEATSLEEIRADHELTVVQFWTFGCRNCKNTIPALQDIRDEFGDRIAIVGVHAPEFSHEAEVDNIVAAAAELGVTWPIALDTEKRNFHRWQEGPTAFWPRVYLIDGENQIRFDERGDGTRHYVALAETIERLLAGEA